MSASSKVSSVAREPERKVTNMKRDEKENDDDADDDDHGEDRTMTKMRRRGTSMIPRMSRSASRFIRPKNERRCFSARLEIHNSRNNEGFTIIYVFHRISNRRLIKTFSSNLPIKR